MSNMDLKGKKILFISTRTFGIPETILEKLREFGADVDFYDERPANTFFVKALIRINRNFVGCYINKYHQCMLDEIKDRHYDYIFFIKGEAMSEVNLKILFAKHPAAKTIIYHWDSIANNRNAKTLLPYFQKKYTFDRSDSCELGMNFLPLFYFSEYKEVAKAKIPQIYDMMFVGTTHSDRYRFIKSLAKQIEKYGGKSFIYFFFQGKIMFYKHKFTHSEMKKLDSSEIHFLPLNKLELIELYKQSKIIVDAQHPKQTGLTLRCLEALGSKRKLITCNKDIKNYDFYNPDNILVVDRDTPLIPKNFIDKPFVEVNEDIYEKYSLDSWVQAVFSE